MKLRLLIADDEPLARARLRALIQELGHEVCAEAADADQTTEALQAAHPDAVLLDIEMPGTEGLSLAERIKTNYPNVSVVLVTAHAGHALAAFDAAVRDYVLKPVKKARLAKALDRLAQVRHAGPHQTPTLRVTIGRKEQLIKLDQIDCFLAEAGYVIARSASLEGFVDGSLEQLAAQHPKFLLRVHRSCLAVKSSISGVEHRSPTDHRLTFKDGLAPLRISRRKLAMTRRHLLTSM